MVGWCENNGQKRPAAKELWSIEWGGIMKANFSDVCRVDYKGYMEPILLTAANHEAEKRGITRSKYIRFAVINQLIHDRYPLNKVSDKFNKFIEIHKGISALK